MDRKLTIFVLMIVVWSSALVVSADRGMIPILPDVSIYEPGQKAIIGWNGEEEILILSTDVSSSYNTTTLEILPLPSNPKRIVEASLDSFHVIEQLIWHHIPPAPQGYLWNKTDEVKVIFHEKIGMHDITVVEAGNVSRFVEWMAEFLIENGISGEVSLENFELVIEDCMLRGFHFYVLDLIELSLEKRSVEPILYEFDTSFLYYPLLITSPIGGEGKIILFILTEGVVEEGYYPLAKARYHGLNLSEPIQFRLSNEELSTIDPSIGDLFQGKAWMTVLTYEGPLDKLTEDMVITEITPVVAGDTYGDGDVDATDLFYLAAAYGSKKNHPDLGEYYHPSCDFDGDSDVDSMDLFTLAANYGTTL